MDNILNIKRNPTECEMCGSHHNENNVNLDASLFTDVELTLSHNHSSVISFNEPVIINSTFIVEIYQISLNYLKKICYADVASIIFHYIPDNLLCRLQFKKNESECCDKWKQFFLTHKKNVKLELKIDCYFNLQL